MRKGIGIGYKKTQAEADAESSSLRAKYPDNIQYMAGFGVSQLQNLHYGVGLMNQKLTGKERTKAVLDRMKLKGESVRSGDDRFKKGSFKDFDDKKVETFSRTNMFGKRPLNPMAGFKPTKLGGISEHAEIGRYGSYQEQKAYARERRKQGKQTLIIMRKDMPEYAEYKKKVEQKKKANKPKATKFTGKKRTIPKKKLEKKPK
jgi:hypothetical protein